MLPENINQLPESLANQNPAREKYSPELFEEICQRFEMGESLKAILRDVGINIGSFHGWINERHGPDERRRICRDRYEQARKLHAEAIVDDLLNIADTPMPGTITRTKRKPGKVLEDGTQQWIEETTTETGEDNVERSKLRLAARQWLAAKLDPKYADKQQIDLNIGLQDLPDQLRQAQARGDAARTWQASGARPPVRLLDVPGSEISEKVFTDDKSDKGE